MVDRISTLADVARIEQIPLSERDLPVNAYEAIARWGRETPDKVAIYGLRSGSADEAPSELTFGELLGKINQTANLLTSLGVGEKDAVSLLLPIIPETHIALWGAEAAGVANPVNSFLEVDHLASIMRTAGTKVIVGCHPSISPDGWPKIEALRDQLPGLEAVIQIGGDGTDVGNDVIQFEQAIADQPGDRLISGRQIGPDDIAAYFHTGGTTGVPKLARHTHRGQVLHSFVLSMMLEPDPENLSMIGVPLFHVGGATCGGHYPLSMGQAIVMLHPEGFRDPVVVRDFFRNAERFKATGLGGVPAIWSALLNVPVEGLDLSRVRYGMVGGAPLSVEVANAVMEKMGLPMVEGWGMTETHGFAAYTPIDGLHKVGSVGIRTPYTEVRVVQLDDAGNVARTCDTDEIGVLLVRGPQVIAGYVDPAHNKDTWVEDDWLNTGDLARIDADGYIWITGRAKDIIIRGGHNIDPALIEDVLYQHPDVELAAALGRPDRRVGEIPVAYVQMKPGQVLDEETMKAFVAERIAERAANPAQIIALGEMPLTGVGKIFKPALRLDAAERTFQAQLDAAGIDARVSVDNHKIHGTLATVTVKTPDSVDACRDCLADYAIRHDVVVAGD